MGGVRETKWGGGKGDGVSFLAKLMVVTIKVTQIFLSLLSKLKGSYHMSNIQR